MIIRIGVFWRHEDETGVSGEGLVADVVEFPNGTCIYHWRGATPSMAIYPNIKQMEAVHGHGGKTEVVFYSEIEAPRNPVDLLRLCELDRAEGKREELARKVAESAARWAAPKEKEKEEQKP